jgi:hypothetical protein
LQFVFYHQELVPGDVAWIGCSHIIPASPVVLFHYTSAWKFGKDIEQALSRGADYAVRDGKPKNRAGILRPVAAVLWRGRQDAALNGKNANMDVCVFFYFSAPDHGERGKPGGEGEGEYMPP